MNKDLNITEEEYCRLIQDGSVFRSETIYMADGSAKDDIEALIEFYRSYNHAATCSEITNRIKILHTQTLNGQMTQLGKRICEKSGHQKLKALSGSGNSYWPFLFLGRELKGAELAQRQGCFEWKLKPELARAIERLFPEVENPYYQAMENNFPVPVDDPISDKSKEDGARIFESKYKAAPKSAPITSNESKEIVRSREEQRSLLTTGVSLIRRIELLCKTMGNNISKLTISFRCPYSRFSLIHWT